MQTEQVIEFFARILEGRRTLNPEVDFIPYFQEDDEEGIANDKKVQNRRTNNVNLSKPAPKPTAKVAPAPLDLGGDKPTPVKRPMGRPGARPGQRVNAKGETLPPPSGLMTTLQLGFDTVDLGYCYVIFTLFSDDSCKTLMDSYATTYLYAFLGFAGLNAIFLVYRALNIYLLSKKTLTFKEGWQDYIIANSPEMGVWTTEIILLLIKGFLVDFLSSYFYAYVVKEGVKMLHYFIIGKAVLGLIAGYLKMGPILIYLVANALFGSKKKEDEEDKQPPISSTVMLFGIFLCLLFLGPFVIILYVFNATDSTWSSKNSSALTCS